MSLIFDELGYKVVFNLNIRSKICTEILHFFLLGVVLVSMVGLNSGCDFELVRCSTALCQLVACRLALASSVLSLWCLFSASSWRFWFFCILSGLVLLQAKWMAARSCASLTVVSSGLSGLIQSYGTAVLKGQFCHPGKREGWSGVSGHNTGMQCHCLVWHRYTLVL